ncbi:DUF4269 domain-containing protein [Pedobacter helvus]|uniref:DUF4269 domain-containing protein n=1 Tax=Pedobacter helvus TaxID=2563444 RepID=A0ABW9JMS9_9SPHI|nr:DUF4269 domain-containing protein [Pedobacter ureilyticus]
MDFLKIDYLKEGSKKQRAAYQALITHRILEKLSQFEPILAGTIPINIDIDNSDLDIICYWKEKHYFIETLQALFAEKQAFLIRETSIDGEESVVCSFNVGEFEVEIFGQNIPSKQQNAYLHLLVEHQILQQQGEDFRRNIIALKKIGYKTEPAFAKLLELKGNPYQALLELYLQ